MSISKTQKRLLQEETDAKNRLESAKNNQRLMDEAVTELRSMYTDLRRFDDVGECIHVLHTFEMSELAVALVTFQNDTTPAREALLAALEKAGITEERS